MLSITPTQVSTKLRSLFDITEPAGIRCLAVLEGDAPGQILTDNADQPTWSILRETAFETVYLGGDVDASLLAQVMADFRREGDVLLGFWPDDERINLLPPEPEYEGWVLDFLDRPIGEDLGAYLQIPEGCHIRRVDRTLINQCVDGEGQIAAFGSLERALKDGFGFCLMLGDEILSEALAGPPTMGIMEMGTATREPYRGRGYATITSAYLIQACETAGYETYWNCDAANLPSAAIARKMGYRSEKRYKLFAWFKSG